MRIRVPFLFTFLCTRVPLLSTLLVASVYAQTSASTLAARPVDDATRTILLGNVHPMARPAFDRGEAPSDLPLERLIFVLKRSAEQERALRRLLEDQQNRDSPSYHRWLAPKEFGANFGPAAADVMAVVQWLKNSGFEVSGVSNSRMFIEFSGTAGLVRQAFAAPVHKFMVNGKEHLANVSDPSVPSALASVVAGIDSLHDFRRMPQNRYVGHYSVSLHALSTPRPEFTLPNGQSVDYAVVPFDFATIYNLLPLWHASPTPITGKGETIAIVARSDFDPKDTTGFWSLFALNGTNAPKPTLVRTFNGPKPGITADESETDIDSQWSGATAPGATINVVESASTATTDGVDLSALYIVDNNLAPVISESYGQCEKAMGSAAVAFYGDLWEQAAAQGMSVVVSTGDNGAAGCDNPDAPAQNGLNVNGIASTPFNIAVGGTDFNQYQAWSNYWNAKNNSTTFASAKGYIPETTWNDSCTNGLLEYLDGGSSDPESNCNNTLFKDFLDSTAGGGGESTSWLKPEWQVNTQRDNARDVPDISLFASNGFLNSYYIICQGSGLSGECINSLKGYGGTSVAAPAFAGIVAMVDQRLRSQQGMPGFILYRLASIQRPAFHDVPAGTTNSVPCVSGTMNCETLAKGDAYGLLAGWSTLSGYDLATGLGSVDAAQLVDNWSRVSFAPTTTRLVLNGGAEVKVKHGAAVSIRIHVAPSTSSGDVSLVVAPARPGDPGIGLLKATDGFAHGSTTLFPGGSYGVMAHFEGTGSYGGSYSNAVPVTVAAEGSKTMAHLVSVNANGKLLSFSAANATYGGGYSALRVDVGNSKATYTGTKGIFSTCSNRVASCPTGVVTIDAPGTKLDGSKLALNGLGYAELPLSPGSYPLKVAYPGDASYASSSAEALITILRAPTRTTAALDGSPIEFGLSEEVSVEADTQSEGAAPTGTFQFYIDQTPIGKPVDVYESDGYRPNGSPKYAWADAISDPTFYNAGTHRLTARYSGDTNYAPSISPAVTFEVERAQAIISDWGWGANSAKIGQTVKPYMIVDGQGGLAALPTGTFSFYDNGTLIKGPVHLSPQITVVVVTTSYAFKTPGRHTLKVEYSGDVDYMPASAAGLEINVSN